MCSVVLGIGNKFIKQNLLQSFTFWGESVHDSRVERSDQVSPNSNFCIKRYPKDIYLCWDIAEKIQYREIQMQNIYEQLFGLSNAPIQNLNSTEFHKISESMFLKGKKKTRKWGKKRKRKRKKAGTIIKYMVTKRYRDLWYKRNDLIMA